jgi:hypothetical protein
MQDTQILKTGCGRVFPMTQQLDGKLKPREPLPEEEKAALRAKASTYALLNRPSPPF